MKTSEQLELVKPWLIKCYNQEDDGGPELRSRYLCNAVELASEVGYLFSGTDADVIKSIIRFRIRGEYTMTDWLRKYEWTVEQNNAFHNLSYIEQYNYMQQYRCEWLDALIKEFKAKGD